MRQRSVWWIVAALATALAIAIPAVLWQTWSNAAAPTAPHAAAGKRAKKVAAGSKPAAAEKDKAAGGAAGAHASANGGGTVYFDRNGTPLARFVALQYTDPAGGAAATGQRYVEATIAMQNLTTSSLSLAPEMFQVRDLTGGLHIPISTASGGGAPGATPAAGKRAAPAATSAKSAKADKSAKPAKPTKPAKASKATQATQAAQAAHGARSAATPRAGVAKRSGKNGAAPASFTGAGIALAPGQTRTETLRFAVPASARVGSILFAPDQNHLISLAILPQSASSSPAASSAGSDRAAKAAKPGKPVKARATPKR